MASGTINHIEAALAQFAEQSTRELVLRVSHAVWSKVMVDITTDKLTKEEMNSMMKCCGNVIREIESHLGGSHSPMMSKTSARRIAVRPDQVPTSLDAGE